MALSTKTALQMWDRAQEDLRLNANSESYLFRIADINESIRMVVGLFYDLMASHYEAQTTLVPATTGRYYVSGASWDVDLNRLTATMDTNFASGDVGNLVVFRDGTDIYLGTISAFVSTTVVELMGDNLPSADIATLEDVLMAATSPTSDVVSLSSVDMMRTGQQIRLKLDTSLTTSTSVVRTKPATLEQILSFRASAVQNQNLILYALSGSNLYLAKGSNLSSYGTLTLYYPGQPTNVTADSSNLDIPDGSPYEIAVLYYENILRRREGMPAVDTGKEIEFLIRSLYNTYRGELSAEVLKEKANKLK